MAIVRNSIKSSSGGNDITVVANYSALPDPTTVSGKFYWCSSSQGTSWLPGSLGGTYYNSGMYYSNGTTWEYINVPFQATQSEVNTGTNTDKFLTPKTFNDSTQLASKEDKSAWIDISSSATIVGWSSYTTKIVKYKLENKMVVFFVNIEGTSNSQTTTLDLGMNVVEGMRFVTTAQNNGTRELGAATITSGTSLIDFKRTITGTAYSSVGNKTINFTQHFEIS